MKLKYYMCGFGSGIILAVLVLVIANKITAGSGAASNVNQQGTTEAAGSVIAYTTQAAATSQEASANNHTDKADVQSNAATDTATYAATDKTTVTDNNNQTDMRTDSTTVNNNEQKEQVTVHINAVTVASDIADMLEENGIIDSAQGFIQYMYNHGYSRVIQEGDFTLSKGDSYENVARIITRQ